MADVNWVRIRSWHAVKEEIGHVPEGYVMRTYCGRAIGVRDDVMPLKVDALPGGKSCETCLRIVEWKGT